MMMRSLRVIGSAGAFCTPARSNAGRQHDQTDRARADTHRSPSRKEGNEATTLHSLPNVLVVGWWPFQQ